MTPKKIIYSKNATIVFWQDGSKTIVKREKGVKDDKYSAVCAALAKKTYGSNSHFKKLIKDAENAKEIPKKKPQGVSMSEILSKSKISYQPPTFSGEAQIPINFPDDLRRLW